VVRLGQPPGRTGRGALSAPTKRNSTSQFDVETAPDIARGALFIAASALCFASVGALVKLTTNDLPNEMLVFFRNLFGVLFLLPLLAHQGLATLRTRCFHLHVLRALFGLGALYGYFFTLTVLPLSIAVLLTFSAPLFIPFVARAWLVGQAGNSVILRATLMDQGKAHGAGNGMPFPSRATRP